MADKDFVEQYKRKFDQFCKGLDDKLLQFPLCQKVTESTNVRPSHIAILLTIIAAIIICLNLAPNAIVNIIGFVHPAYYSFCALETKTDDDDKQWLTYWIVYALFNVIESVTDVLIEWIPLYYLFKVILIIWISHPTYRGAQVLFQRIHPVVLSIRNVISGKPAKPQTLDEKIKSIKGDLNRNVENALNKDIDLRKFE